MMIFQKRCEQNVHKRNSLHFRFCKEGMQKYASKEASYFLLIECVMHFFKVLLTQEGGLGLDEVPSLL